MGLKFLCNSARSLLRSTDRSEQHANGIDIHLIVMHKCLQAWRTDAGQKGVQVYSSLEIALSHLNSESASKRPESVFVIGGGQVMCPLQNCPRSGLMHTCMNHVC